MPAPTYYGTADYGTACYGACPTGKMPSVGRERPLIVAEPGWTNPHAVRVSGITTTIGVSQVGTLTALLPAQDQPIYGFGNDWKGLWVRYDHATQDPWSGEIVDDKPSSSGRTIDLVAQSPAGTFAQRRLPATYLPVMATPGALVKAAIRAVGTRRYLWIDDVAVTESGRPITGEARADDLLSYIQAIAQASGQEWIDGTHADGSWFFRFDRQVGEDKMDRVWLIEGVHCADVESPSSIRTLVNDLLGIGDDRPYAAAAKVVVTEPGSLTRPWGRREGAIRYSGVTAEGGVEPLASADVARLSEPPTAPTLRMPALHPVAAEIRPGDRIRLSSWSANKESVFRALTQTVSDNGTVLTLTGVAEEVPETWGPYGLLGSFILGDSLLS